ncbi:MAG: Hsp70 family protein [bacterium]|nr:Hsp70 family protein [bacterium]
MTAQFVIGIDLGTTNSVVAFARLEEESPTLELLRIPQLVDPHTVEERTSLASFCYLAGEPSSSLDLPWAGQRDYCVGEFARRNSAEHAERTISAAKSWLSYSRVDRRAPILPWNTPAKLEKLSPVAASQLYLEHLVAAWNLKHPDAPLKDQQVVLTVPASFDAAARELTREAAVAAGLPDDLILLEEPQAAVYAWLAQSGDAWRKALTVGDRLLVCDVGGGTTDLTLIEIQEQDGELFLERKAVGNHLLVGGDNMDLTLAHQVAAQFAEKGVRLDPWQSISLWHSCRTAKETLLATQGPEKHTIAVLGRGSKLIGGTVSVEVDREAVGQLLVDGFLPRCSLQDQPARQRASGFQQLGLPFESDTGITRHIAAFLSSQSSPPDNVLPTHVLFNGGVFKATALQQRLLEVLNSWRDAGQTTALPGARDLDHAVAIGAAYYRWAKQHGGVRIRGGVAHAYYVGVETAGLAIPGAPRPLHALCVVPMGMEEGTEVDVPSAEIGLVHGEQAEFRFFSSAVRKDDQPGDILQSWDEGELSETTPLTTTLQADESVTEAYVPVKFQSRITELGMFELWCVATNGDGNWKLEFNVRDSSGDAPSA